MNKIQKCAICGKKFSGYGNSTWPVTESTTDRCCDHCNKTKVLVARLAMISSRKNPKISS